MGCALRKGLLANDVFVVGLYSPPGNVGDGVSVNVLRPGIKEAAKPDVYSNIFRRNKVTVTTNKNNMNRDHSIKHPRYNLIWKLKMRRAII